MKLLKQNLIFAWGVSLSLLISGAIIVGVATEIYI